MAIKRVLVGATEIKELITYEDETKESVGKGQAGQVLKTDGTNTYWGEGGGTNLEPINIGGTITGWENDFSIDNIEITEEHYNQFVQNKYAPIALKLINDTNQCIFTLYKWEDYGDNNAYCFYGHIFGKYRYVICIEWDSGDGIVDDVYYEPIGGSLEMLSLICEMSNEDTQDTNNSYVMIDGAHIQGVVFDINKKYLLEISNESNIGLICFSEYVKFFGDNNSSRTTHKFGCHYESESDGPTPVTILVYKNTETFTIVIRSVLDKPLYGATVKLYQVY